jgi:hypothetical protein
MRPLEDRTNVTRIGESQKDNNLFNTIHILCNILCSFGHLVVLDVEHWAMIGRQHYMTVLGSFIGSRQVKTVYKLLKNKHKMNIQHTALY